MQGFHRLATPVIAAVALVSAAMLMSFPRLEGSAAATPAAAVMPPEPAPIGVAASSDTAVFAGGCFWGVEAVFKHVKGVTSAVSGYAGGSAKTAHYEIIGTGLTGHAESVQVTYDPSQISYGQLLRVFFSVAHDPTQLNRQGPDVGTQYRSAIFYADPEQQRVAQAYIDQLSNAKTFARPIVTQLTPLNAFYPAEDYHQDYLAKHPESMYIVVNDLPKLNNLRQEFPQIYVSR
jgi:peptide-methionine (S)-S-oxide reductase